jgi:hypothetical protein
MVFGRRYVVENASFSLRQQSTTSTKSELTPNATTSDRSAGGGCTEQIVLRAIVPNSAVPSCDWRTTNYGEAAKDAVSWLSRSTPHRPRQSQMKRRVHFNEAANEIYEFQPVSYRLHPTLYWTAAEQSAIRFTALNASCVRTKKWSKTWNAPSTAVRIRIPTEHRPRIRVPHRSVGTVLCPGSGRRGVDRVRTRAHVGGGQHRVVPRPGAGR